MTTIEKILNPKAQVEEAWTAILKKANASVFPVFSLEEKKLTPYVEAALTNLRVSDRPQQQSYGEILLYASWSGTMISRVVTDRNTNSEQHEPMVNCIMSEAALFALK